MASDISFSHLVAPPRLIEREQREYEQGHSAKVFWLTGLSGAGKSTIAHKMEQILFASGIRNVTVLDGDRLRGGLCSDLGFSAEARYEKIRRAAQVAKMFLEQGIICLCAFISPHKADRENASAVIGAGDFFEVYVSCPQHICEKRDVKGFYRLARQGIIKNYTGISTPYEEPERPALTIRTDMLSIDEGVEHLHAFILNCIR
jgi:adenylylsulfate kinase